MHQRLMIAIAAAGLFFGSLNATLAQDTGGEGLRAALETLGAADCEEAEGLTCVTLTVPRDHRANDPENTLEITFAISLATDDSKGLLFYAVGGPGGSGIQSAVDYLAAFDESLAANMDIVFFDQRGMGSVQGIGCPLAQAVFDAAEMPLDRPEESLASARSYVADCLAEAEADDLLAVVNTGQAVRDLELFRQAIGAPKVWLYGESYGTQFMQEYATAFPQAPRGVILDGVVDLTLSFEGYSAAYVQAAERILKILFESCADNAQCRTDMVGDAWQVYDDLMARLSAADVSVDYPLGDGTSTPRPFTAGMLKTIAFYALYGPDDRAPFLRALAAASRDDLLPLLDLAYSSLLIDPATVEGYADPAWFGAAYYAVTCTDYGDDGESPADKEARILAQAQDMAKLAPRMIKPFHAERLVCANWPQQGPLERPEPFAGGDYPTVVLTSDVDPITPISMANTVYDNVRNGSMIVMQGGPHVIWGRGLACPDQTMAALLYDGTLPPAGVQICSQPFLGDYAPLTLTDPADMASPLAVARALALELEQSWPLYGWDGGDPFAVGCPKGGVVTISAAETGTAYDFAACSWWKGLVTDGSALLVENGEAGDGLGLELALSGDHQGTISYFRDATTETEALSGDYDGKPAEVPRALP